MIVRLIRGYDLMFTQHWLPPCLRVMMRFLLFPNFLLHPFPFIPETTHQETDRKPSGWLQLTPHLEMRTKVCNGAPKINRMWLIAATVTLSAQTVRTKAGEEMRGAFLRLNPEPSVVKELCHWNQQGSMTIDNLYQKSLSAFRKEKYVEKTQTTTLIL